MRLYNWVRDDHDARDHKYEFVGPRQTLPPLVDLRAKCPPVVDQGQVGSCTANALAGAIGYMELNELAAGFKGEALEFDGQDFKAFSRMFIYYNERDLENDIAQDSGAQIRDGVKSLAALGCCSEDAWPYKGVDALFSRANIFTKPSAAAYTEAAGHKITSYLSLDHTELDVLRSCLAGGYPFVFGFTVFPSFESEAVAFNGKMPMPGAKESPQGGHAVLAVGYDDARGVFIVRNSWGSTWGDGGYFYMPYAYATDPDLASDFWTLRK